jgi:hypothetical protein
MLTFSFQELFFIIWKYKNSKVLTIVNEQINLFLKGLHHSFFQVSYKRQRIPPWSKITLRFFSRDGFAKQQGRNSDIRWNNTSPIWKMMGVLCAAHGACRNMHCKSPDCSDFSPEHDCQTSWQKTPGLLFAQTCSSEGRPSTFCEPWVHTLYPIHFQMCLEKFTSFEFMASEEWAISRTEWSVCWEGGEKNCAQGCRSQKIASLQKVLVLMK